MKIFYSLGNAKSSQPEIPSCTVKIVKMKIMSISSVGEKMEQLHL
jgi:hypothetical protein